MKNWLYEVFSDLLVCINNGEYQYCKMTEVTMTEKTSYGIGNK